MNPRVYFVARFALFFGTVALLSWACGTETGNLHVVEPLTRLQVMASEGIISFFGGTVHREGTLLVGPEMSLDVKDGCNGIVAMILFGSAVVAHPTLITLKLAGLGAGLLSILAVNLVRIMTLFMVATVAPDWLEFFHVYFWQTLLIIIVVFFWYVWASRSLIAEVRAATPVG